MRVSLPLAFLNLDSDTESLLRLDNIKTTEHLRESDIRHIRFLLGDIETIKVMEALDLFDRISWKVQYELDLARERDDAEGFADPYPNALPSAF
jgi:hypothetical protein